MCGMTSSNVGVHVCTLIFTRKLSHGYHQKLTKLDIAPSVFLNATPSQPVRLVHKFQIYPLRLQPNVSKFSESSDFGITIIESRLLSHKGGGENWGATPPPAFRAGLRDPRGPKPKGHTKTTLGTRIK